MRRLSVTLAALAFLWACAATGYLLLASTRTGIAGAATLAAAGDATQRLPPPLATSAGVWVAGLLMGVTLLAGLPLGIALSHPRAHCTAAWTVGCVLAGFCVLSGASGLLYVPSTILLMAAGATGRVAAPA